MSSCDVIRILASQRNSKNSERFNELNEIKVIPHEEKVDLSWLDSSRRKVAYSIDRGNSINEREMNVNEWNKCISGETEKRVESAKTSSDVRF